MDPARNRGRESGGGGIWAGSSQKNKLPPEMREEAPEREYSRDKGTECGGHGSPRSPLPSMQGAGAGPMAGLVAWEPQSNEPQAKPSACRQQEAIKGFWASKCFGLLLENNCWQKNEKLSRWEVLRLSCSSNGEESAYEAGDQGLIAGSGRLSGEGNDNPLHYSCLENPMDIEAWQATVFMGSQRVR